MFPVLFAFGPFKLFTLNIFLVLAFLTSAFVFWKKGREEHYSESELFDGFLLSTLVGLVVGRAGYVLGHFSQFNLNIGMWLDSMSHPGLSLTTAFGAAGVYMYWYAKHKKWDAFEILDFWTLSMAAGLGWLFLGFFFEGSYFGSATNLPWGVIFPGLVQKHHPVQLYYAAFFFIASWYLSKLEYRYRLFNWYRGGKNTAQTGFLISVFMSASFFFAWLLNFIALPGLVINGINVERWLLLLGCISGLCLLYVRSGRSVWSWRSKRSAGLKNFKVD